MRIIISVNVAAKKTNIKAKASCIIACSRQTNIDIFGRRYFKLVSFTVIFLPDQSWVTSWLE